MTTQTIQNELMFAYTNIEKAIQDANRTAFKYEVFISDDQHKVGDSYVVDNIDTYLLFLEVWYNNKYDRTTTNF